MVAAVRDVKLNRFKTRDGKSETGLSSRQKSRATHDSALENDFLIDVIFAFSPEFLNPFLIFQLPVRQFVQAPFLMNSLNIFSLSSGVSL